MVRESVRMMLSLSKWAAILGGVFYGLISIVLWDPFWMTLDGCKWALRLVAGSTALALYMCLPVFAAMWVEREK